VVPGRRTDKHRQAQNWHSISPELFIFHCLAGEQRSAMPPAGANFSGCGHKRVTARSLTVRDLSL